MSKSSVTASPDALHFGGHFEGKSWVGDVYGMSFRRLPDGSVEIFIGTPNEGRTAIVHPKGKALLSAFLAGQDVMAQLMEGTEEDE